MRLVEFVTEATTRAYAKHGASQSLKFRCTSGSRKGQVRASPAACNAPINIKKSKSLSQTKQRKGGMMSTKANVTKRSNSTSQRVQAMNKPKSRGRKKV
jgi:hypothetical protein|tara:strand:- start:3440 stop:3736 length:297 start_codon:yes stop_codon:yes gene_type:complete